MKAIFLIPPYFYGMYKRISKEKQEKIDFLWNSLSLEEKVGQTWCLHAKQYSPRDMGRIVEKYPVGSLFFAYRNREDTLAITEAVNKHSSIPVITTADLVNGAGSRVEGCTLFPWQMAVGAADSEDLAEKMGRATAVEGRASGLHWTFGPIVDLSINQDNAMMHTRSFGEDPDHVVRMAKAFVKGVQRENLMAATAKHFPGDGIDDRDSHICTSVNSLSEKEWMESYGKVWRQVLDDGVKCVMPGHIALPWLDPARNYLGPMPATLSRKIQIDLLRDRFGFEGVVVSDAIPMIGFSAMAPVAERIPLNIETGSDLILWPEPERDWDNMFKALSTGLLSEERLETAGKNVLALKEDLGLLQEGEKESHISPEQKKAFLSWADEIGDNSITIIRNENSLLPLNLAKGAKVLTVTIAFDEDTRGYVQELDVVDEELRKRGFEVDHLFRPGCQELNEAAPFYDAVFVNIHIMPRYGTTKYFGATANTLWDSFWMEHGRVVFTSFGDPYKLYEMPYCPNYINTYSNTPSSQKAAVKVWLGESEAKGKIPVNCQGYFSLQVKEGE